MSFGNCKRNAYKAFMIRKDLLGFTNIETLKSWNQYLYGSTKNTFLFYGKVIKGYLELIETCEKNLPVNDKFTLKVKIFYV